MYSNEPVIVKYKTKEDINKEIDKIKAIKGVKSIKLPWLKSYHGKIEGRMILEVQPSGRIWFIDTEELRIIKFDYLPTILPSIIK